MIYSVGIFAFVILCFSLLIVSGKLLYKKRTNVKYSFKNMFPFELNYKADFKDNLYIHIFVALFVMASIGFFATFNTTFDDGYIIFTIISGILTAICALLLFYIPLANLRFHLILDAIFFTLNFACVASVLVTAWRTNQVLVSWASVTSIVLSILIGLLEFALIMNPKLNLNFKPIEVVKENGEKEYLRPKGIVLAFSEWTLLFLYIFNMLNVLILTFAL